jgi:hypothetical protein
VYVLSIIKDESYYYCGEPLVKYRKHDQNLSLISEGEEVKELLMFYNRQDGDFSDEVLSGIRARINYIKSEKMAKSNNISVIYSLFYLNNFKDVINILIILLVPRSIINKIRSIFY